MHSGDRGDASEEKNGIATIALWRHLDIAFMTLPSTFGLYLPRAVRKISILLLALGFGTRLG
jgi:hypothetical protein